MTHDTRPDCDYCKNPAELWRWGHEHYPYGRNYGRVWGCKPCAAWVGCHPKGNGMHPESTPLGRLANAELRMLKQQAHAAFDRLWQAKWKQGTKKFTARRAGYAWLAQQLGISVDDCHIGMFDDAQCRSVIEICRPFHRENRRPDSATAIEGDRHGEQSER